MKKYVFLVAISILLSACSVTKQVPVSQTQPENTENICDSEIGKCDCTTWPEDNCLLPYSLVMEQLKTGEHPDKITNQNGQTMLMKARDVESVKALIAAGADVNAKSDYGATPLMYAAYKGNVDAVKALISAGADVNAKEDKDGVTPLMYAAEKGNVESIKALISAGSDVNAKDKDGWTPLMYAAKFGDIENVKALISAGADVNAKNNAGATPLMLAAKYGEIESVEALISAGADVNAKVTIQPGGGKNQGNSKNAVLFFEFEANTRCYTV